MENARRKVEVIVGETIMLQAELSNKDKVISFRGMLANMLKEKYNRVRLSLTKVRG